MLVLIGVMHYSQKLANCAVCKCLWSFLNPVIMLPIRKLDIERLGSCGRWLHHIHHKYNKEHTLSPFAGLAFHPLDGIIQVSAATALR